MVDAKGRKSTKVVHDEPQPKSETVSKPATVEKAMPQTEKQTAQVKTSAYARAQLSELDQRLGKGQGAVKERAKLAKLLG